MIENLGHVALGVKDIERSLRFYRDVLGMKVLMELEIADDRIGRVIGSPGAKCRIVHLRLGTGILELFQYSNPVGTNRAVDMSQYDQGLIHLGFEVSEFHRHVAELKQHGVTFLGEPVEFRPNVWVAYFRGPDGEVCEIREQPPKP
jgi:catechol 2,3-dioxygenase-like lactoylglutathione lyase family enzyme